MKYKSFNYLVLVITLASAVLFSERAQAYRIESAYFDTQKEMINLNLVFTGGNKAHEFEIQWDPCVEGPSSHQDRLQGDSPSENRSSRIVKQMAGRLVDTTGWDDAGTQEIQTTLAFRLGDPNCRPAEITIISGQHSRVTLEIP